MPQRRLSTRGITEGAILAALVAIFALASIYVPVLGLATVYLIPLPLAVLVIRHGFAVALLAAGVAGAIAALVAGPLSGAGLLLTFAPAGFSLGWGVARGRSALAILSVTALVSILSLLTGLGLILVVSGVNPYRTMFESMQSGQAAALVLYRSLGVDPSRLQLQGQQMAQTLALLPRLIPLLILGGGLVAAWLNYQVAGALLRRLGHPLPALPRATAWRLPSLAVWALPLAAVLVSLGRPRVFSPFEPGIVAPPQGVIPLIGLNVMVLLQLAFFVQGVLVGWVWLGGRSVAPAARIVLLLLVLFNPLMGPLVTLVGMADSIFRLRARWMPRPVATGGEA